MRCFDNSFDTIGRPLALFSLSLLIVSPALFFVSDRVFRRWLWFTLIWFVVAVVWVALARTAYHTFNPYSNPTKDDAARIMSIPFVVVSYPLLFFWQRKFSSKTTRKQ